MLTRISTYISLIVPITHLAAQRSLLAQEPSSYSDPALQSTNREAGGPGLVCNLNEFVLHVEGDSSARVPTFMCYRLRKNRVLQMLVD